MPRSSSLADAPPFGSQYGDAALHFGWAGNGRGWLLCRNPREVLAAHDPTELSDLLRRAEAAALAGALVVCVVAYEAASGCDASLPAAAPPPGVPYAWFAVYDPGMIERDVPLPSEAIGAAPLQWQPTVTEQAYEHSVRSVLEHIAAGDTYQLNFSFRLRAAGAGDPWDRFIALVGGEPAPYAAYVNLGRLAVLSNSPELFFEFEGPRIVSRPMKGTAPRGRWTGEDDERRAELATCPKNRAENLMIVDMVRNDLGRIAAPGTVAVRSLFDITRFETVWQMTSTVEATRAAGLADTFRALFPPASITGAPKRRTMELIHAIETTPRGVYTGCVGSVGPGDRACFNVAIRTAVADCQADTVEYGVGGGVVADSTPAGEYRECRLKARTVLEPRRPFTLLETLRWEPAHGFWLLCRHLRRLADSAAYFDFDIDLPTIRQALDAAAKRWMQGPHKVRLLLDRTGRVRITGAPLAPRTAHEERVGLARCTVDVRDPFLFHKTTCRTTYERARAGRPDCDEVLLVNELGQVTEASQANVILRLDGGLWTPPIECGLLPGTFRAELLQQGIVRERIVTDTELRAAQELWLVNSVRGWRRARLID